MMHNAHLPTVCVLVGVSAGMGWDRYTRGEGILGTHSPSQDTYYLGYLTPPSRILTPHPRILSPSPFGILIATTVAGGKYHHMCIHVFCCVPSSYVVFMSVDTCLKKNVKSKRREIHNTYFLYV